VQTVPRGGIVTEGQFLKSAVEFEGGEGSWISGEQGVPISGGGKGLSPEMTSR